MSLSRAARRALAATMLVCAAGPALGATVNLTSRDGTISIRGELLSFDGKIYRVKSNLGRVSISADLVTCTGDGCPSAAAAATGASVAGDPALRAALITPLAIGYAEANGFDVIETPDEEDDAASTVAFLNAEGVQVAGLDLSAVTNQEDGFAALLDGEAAAVISARPIGADEAAAARNAGLGDLTSPARERTLARDAVVLALAPDLGVDALTAGQIARIFRGEVANWSELGGPDLALTTHVGPEGDAAAELFRSRVLGGAGFNGVIRHADPVALADAVAFDAGAIGVLTLSGLGGAAPVRITGACGLSVAADAFSVRAGDYPLTSPIYLYSTERGAPEAMEEITAFAQTVAGAEIVSDAGFADLRPALAPRGAFSDRMLRAITASDGDGSAALRALAADLIDARRLSLTLRDASDRRADDALGEAAGLIARDAAAIARVIAVGHSADGDGSESGRDRAALLAETAIRRLRAKMPDDIAAALDWTAHGAGGLEPILCPDAPMAAAVNGRVEFWIERKS